MSAEKNPHVVALREAYRRWRETKGGCADEILALFDVRVEMRSVLGSELPSELAGVHRSKAEAAEYFAALARDWEMLDYVVDQFIADGEYGDDVVMIGRCACATGRPAPSSIRPRSTSGISSSARRLDSPNCSTASPSPRRSGPCESGPCEGESIRRMDRSPSLPSPLLAGGETGPLRAAASRKVGPGQLGVRG